MVLNDRLKTLVDQVPKNICGVYYLYNDKQDIIYIGKSIDIRKRLIQHFKSIEKKEIKLQHFTYSIQFESTGNELIALLRESELIKQNLPIFNRAQRKIKYFYALYKEINSNDYEALVLKKIDNSGNEIISFTSQNEAKDYLFYITEKYKLCQKVNGLYKTKSSCFQYSLKECIGACINIEEPKLYNKRVRQFLKTVHLPKKDFLFELVGRTENEKGIVLIEKGVYKGFGYCDHLLDNLDEMKSFIEQKQDNKDVRKILFRHIKSELSK
ncbi:MULTISPECIES: GIY-YIG nuclease family protein [unclassified Empedobacter]|uniref:GIY-YIG nuclease family protein n=1 Tax=unclassified Empedobacter TaxID=2643773 RepID=UPI0025B9248D|nr:MULTISPECIES: GIY-YIG nuclease family protein [unclassified Empedobacter]